MPRYEYQCKGCGDIVERTRSVEDRNLLGAPCEECGGEFARIVSLTSFSLKGGGWTAKTTIPAEPAPKKPMRGYDMTGSRNE